MFPYNSYLYFFDLLALTLVLLPLHYSISGERGKQLLLTCGGAYLLFCIAPRLLVFSAAITAVRASIHTRLPTPVANITSISAQQQPTHESACRTPTRSPPVARSR